MAPPRIKLDTERIVEEYTQRLRSMAAIARDWNVSEMTIRRRLEDAGVPRRTLRAAAYVRHARRGRPGEPAG